jgi:endonuclease III
VIGAHLAQLWPDAVVELDHQNAYQLLVATILAAQALDKTINTLTPAVFAKYPDATALSQANPLELEPMIKQSGFFRNKAKHLIEAAKAIVERHGGEVPQTMEELCALPGVARKTANVVLGCALGKNEGFIVDTHVTRLAGRLGLSRNVEPEKIEVDLMKLVPREDWTRYANRLIWHGRRVCDAKRPDCEHCMIAPACPSAGLGAQIAAASERSKAETKERAKAKAKAKRAAKPAAKAKPKKAAGKAKAKAKRKARA